MPVYYQQKLLKTIQSRKSCSIAISFSVRLLTYQGVLYHGFVQNVNYFRCEAKR